MFAGFITLGGSLQGVPRQELAGVADAEAWGQTLFLVFQAEKPKTKTAMWIWPSVSLPGSVRTFYAPRDGGLSRTNSGRCFRTERPSLSLGDHISPHSFIRGVTPNCPIRRW
jgi:hypothetical protein